MQEKRNRAASGGRLFLCLFGGTIGVTLISIVLWAFGQKVVATALATFAAFAWLGSIILTTAIVASWWSATLMERGAKLVEAAIVQDDRSDGIMMQQIGNLVSQILRLMQTQAEGTTAPLPSQQLEDWMPGVRRLTAPKRPAVLNREASFTRIEEGQNE